MVRHRSAFRRLVALVTAACMATAGGCQLVAPGFVDSAIGEGTRAVGGGRPSASLGTVSVVHVSAAAACLSARCRLL